MSNGRVTLTRRHESGETSQKSGKQMCGTALRSCDVIFGCVDSIGEKQQLETVARCYLTPYIDVGMDVHRLDEHFSISGQVALSMPGGSCLRCMGIIVDRKLELEAQAYSAVGGRPQVVWPNGLLTSLAVGFFIQLFAPLRRVLELLLLLEFDGDAQTVSRSNRLLYLAEGACRHFACL